MATIENEIWDLIGFLEEKDSSLHEKADEFNSSEDRDLKTLKSENAEVYEILETRENLLKFIDTEPDASLKVVKDYFNKHEESILESKLSPADISEKCKENALNWSNDIWNQIVDNVTIHKPSTIEDIVSIVKQAYNESKQIRFVGSGHSYSKIVQCKDILLVPCNLQGILSHDNHYWCLKNNGGLLNNGINENHYEEVESGIPISHLNEELGKKRKAVLTMGAYHAQTIMGVISTSTHGSRHDMGPIPDTVVSILLVSKDAKIIRVEPDAPKAITNRQKHDAEFKGKVELIQNDTIFNSVLVNMGCMGIVYSVTLGIKNFNPDNNNNADYPKLTEYLDEDRVLTNWEAERKNFENLDTALLHLSKKQTIDYSLLINPYLAKDGTHHCLVSRNKLTAETQKHGAGGMRNCFVSLAVGSKIIGSSTINCLKKADKNKMAKQLNSALWATQDKKYVDKSYKVFITPRPKDVKGFALEMAFPFAHFTEALDTVFNIIDDFAEKENRLFSAPICVRFVGQSKAFLSPQSAWNLATEDKYKITVMIELPMLMFKENKKEYNVQRRDQDIFTLNMLMGNMYEKYKAKEGKMRFHWGLMFDKLPPKYIKEITQVYPQFSDWYRTYQEFNAKGIFSNDFTAQMEWNISPQPDLPL